jgi:hypothetical protein
MFRQLSDGQTFVRHTKVVAIDLQDDPSDALRADLRMLPFCMAAPFCTYERSAERGARLYQHVDKKVAPAAIARGCCFSAAALLRRIGGACFQDNPVKSVIVANRDLQYGQILTKIAHRGRSRTRDCCNAFRDWGRFAGCFAR